MPIDTKKIVWDDAPEPSKITWDDEKPAPQQPVAQQPAPYQPYQEGSDPYADTGRFGENPGTGSSAHVDFAKGILSSPARINQTLDQFGPVAVPARLLKRALGIEKPLDEINDKYAQVPGSTLGRVGALVGDIATAAPMAASLPARILPQIVGNAAVSAGQSPDDPVSGGMWGAAGGAGGHVLARALGGIVRPTVEARELLDRGVALTPGQAAGVGSKTKWLEEQAASLPVASHFIRSAQRRAVEDANVAAAQAVAKLVDDQIKLGRPPREAIEQTREVISKHYDTALADLTAPTMTVGRVLSESVPKIVAENPMMTAAAEKQLKRYVDGRFQQIIKNGVDDMTGSDLKQLDSEIGQQIRNLQSSMNAADKTAAPAWRELQVELRNVMALHAAAGKNEMLNQANNAYRQLLALEKSLPAGGEMMTPRKLGATLGNMEITGTELNKVAGAMGKTLPNTVPNSGTAERLLTAGLPALLMGGGTGATSLGYDTLGAGLIAAGALGSRPGARAMTGSLPGQQMLATALRRGVPRVAVASARKDNE